MSTDPYLIVDELEQRISQWAGSKYAVAVESCTMAILMCLDYCGAKGRTVDLPKRTYPGVACSVIHSGAKINFTNEDWGGIYRLNPFPIIDGALRFRKGMYEKGTLHCLSFHLKKRLGLGRGGMILTDDIAARDWLRLARFDGREPIPLNEQKEFTVIGYNAYMEPAAAAIAIQRFELLRNKKDLEDLPVSEQNYPDLSLHKIYTQ